jgi:hypothetical protein
MVVSAASKLTQFDLELDAAEMAEASGERGKLLHARDGIQHQLRLHQMTALRLVAHREVREIGPVRAVGRG